MDVNEKDVFEEFAEDTEEKTGTFGEEIQVNEPPKYATNALEGEEQPAVAKIPTRTPAEVRLPFPPKDYNKKGQLKKVRGRMLKKLLKAEFKHYLPLTLCFIGLLLLTSVFCGFGLRAASSRNNEPTAVYRPDTVMVASLLLFVGCCMGAVVFTAAYPIARYNKNFFQNEGYLTFSVPASMEEHVLAKRIAAVVVSYLMSVVLVFSVFLAVLITGEVEFFDPEGEVGIFSFFNEAYLTGGNAVAYMLESLFSAMIGGIMLPSLYAALTCLLSKSSGKRKTGTTILLVFIGVAILDSLSASLFTVESIFLQTAAWAHILAWLGILLQTAVAVGCVCFEIWYLKRKLNLK